MLPIEKLFQKITREAHGQVGVAVMILEAKRKIAVKGTDRFPMQSVYKLPIGMAVLHQIDRGALRLDQKITVRPEDLVPARLHSPIRDRYPQGVALPLRELLRYMVSESDGTACDVLLAVVGGPEVVTRYLRGIGIAGIVVATSEKQMTQGETVQYRNWATPEAMLSLLEKLYVGKVVSSASRALLLEFMTKTETGPHRIKGLLPPKTIVAHKTGSSGTVNGLTRATNDAGVVTLPSGKHLAIVVFVSDTRATETVRDGVIAKIARAAWDHRAELES